MGIVYKTQSNWEYIQSDRERMEKTPLVKRTASFEALDYIPITDRVTAQVCVIQHGEKYGLYTADHTCGFGGPGTWCNPTDEPFPYDEVLYCVNSFEFPAPPGLFAFRVGDRWGIIEVIDGSCKTNDKYDASYPLTKRRIIVPCEYGSLEEADAQLGTPHEWNKPVPDTEYE